MIFSWYTAKSVNTLYSLPPSYPKAFVSQVIWKLVTPRALTIIVGQCVNYSTSQSIKRDVVNYWQTCRHVVNGSRRHRSHRGRFVRPIEMSSEAWAQASRTTSRCRTCTYYSCEVESIVLRTCALTVTHFSRISVYNTTSSATHLIFGNQLRSAYIHALNTIFLCLHMHRWRRDNCTTKNQTEDEIALTCFNKTF